MKIEPVKELDQYRITHPTLGSSELGSTWGAFRIVTRNAVLTVISSGNTIDNDGAKGWEHVSVSIGSRCPTWDEMNLVKDLFWKDDETVVQFHPRKSEYVNKMPYCLHLWRKADVEHELPPQIFV